MITANDVLTVLCSNYDTRDFPQNELIACCETGLNFINSRLRSGISANDPLIAETAAAVAHYHFVVRTLAEPDKYESYKVGDVSITNNPTKALERERLLRDEAIARACTILEDGGFGCYAN